MAIVVTSVPVPPPWELETARVGLAGILDGAEISRPAIDDLSEEMSRLKPIKAPTPYRKESKAAKKKALQEFFEGNEFLKASEDASPGFERKLSKEELREAIRSRPVILKSP